MLHMTFGDQHVEQAMRKASMFTVQETYRTETQLQRWQQLQCLCKHRWSKRFLQRQKNTIALRKLGNGPATTLVCVTKDALIAMLTSIAYFTRCRLKYNIAQLNAVCTILLLTLRYQQC